MNSSCVIVIPIYKSELSTYEKIALTQCGKLLSDYDIVILKPDDLEISNMQIGFSYSEVSFPSFYFKTVFSYNDLMLSERFYEKFLNYSYLLIYQLDAFVFKNELKYWCSLGYDYIGAPWLREKEFPTLFKKAKEKIRSYLHRRYNLLDKQGRPDIERQLYNHVGNGGFSLRKVKSFYNVCIQEKELVENYVGRNSSDYHEDMFWSIEVNRKKKRIKIPTYKEALNFSIETAPQRAMTLIKGNMPFGCHAWDKNILFWKPYFKEAGYQI
nr:DUF5672 family protein [uncultured Pedobacter sp.]